MTAKDVLHSQMMAQVLEGKLDQASAAGRLAVSVRQIKRLKRRMLDDAGTRRIRTHQEPLDPGMIWTKRGISI